METVHKVIVVVKTEDVEIIEKDDLVFDIIKILTYFNNHFKVSKV